MSFDDLFMDCTLMFSESERKRIEKYGPERSRLRQPTILMVEDQPFSRKLLMEMLNKNFTCYQAENVREAVALYAEIVPSIVFLDIELPDIDGHQFASFIKANDPNSYIIMCTGHNMSKDVQQAMNNKVQGYIVKPYSKQKIMDAIEKYSASRKK